MSQRLWLRFGVLGLPGGMGVDARDRDREWESRRLRVGLAGRGTSSAAVGVFALVVVAGDAVVRTLDSDDSAALNFFVAAEAEADPLTGVCEREGSLAAEPGTVRSLDDEDWLSGRFGVKGTCERVPRDCPAVDVDIEEVLLVVLVEGDRHCDVVGRLLANDERELRFVPVTRLSHVSVLAQ